MSDNTESVTEEEVATPAPAPEPKGKRARANAAAKTSTGLVSVFNPNSLHFVQPSTGIRIGGKQTKDLKQDAWLDLQVKAGVLDKA